jgi:hypothetical protein
MKLIEMIKPLNGTPIPLVVIVFHAVVAVLVFIILIVLISLLVNTLIPPWRPSGSSAVKDYDAAQGGRDSLVAYMASKGLPVDSTLMNQFSVATASFGGVFTNEKKWTWKPWNSPWFGSVNPEAARLQVEAGARAMVLDIWPDPADRQSPVVCCMLDTRSWSLQDMWKKGGLNKGVGRYSNWMNLTRNKRPVGEILTAAITAAFNKGGTGARMAEDPFFLILKLHGAMSVAYLNHLGDIVRKAIGGHSMGVEWNKCVNQKSIGTAPVVSFLSKVFLMVIPEIDPGYYSLPNVSSYSAFTPVFLSTRLGEITNSLEQNPNTIFFEPSGITAISARDQPNCANPTGPQQSLAQVGFCLVQPSTGGEYTDNAYLYAQNSYTKCLESGAQFVAVNLFSPNTKDGVLDTFFDQKYFGKYSFRKI